MHQLVREDAAEGNGDIGAKQIEAFVNRGFGMGHQYVSTKSFLPNGILPPVGDTSGRLDSKEMGREVHVGFPAMVCRTP